MYLIQKAGKNLLKNKGRNIIMLVLLSIVATASIIALTIWNVTGQLNKETENYYAGEVSLKLDTDTPQGSPLTLEDYKRFVNSDYLHSYAFYKSMPINIIGLNLLDGNTDSSGKGISINARLYGLLDGKSSDDFSYGERAIIKGNFPVNKTECIISSNLADLNGLSVGDVIIFNTPERAESKIELTISGISSDTTMEYRDPNHRLSIGNTRNDIITTYDFFGESDRLMEAAYSFLLKNSDDLTAFQSELYAKGLPKSYTVQYDTARYKKVMEQINQIAVVVSLFIGIIAIIGIGIVFLVNLFALRERKYEIGVYRAIGAPKYKVAFLLTGEMLFLALLGIVIAVITGSFLNPPVVNFLKSEMSHDMPSALKAATASINGAFSLTVVAELIALTFALVVLAGSATLGSIMRFNPMKILSERN